MGKSLRGGFDFLSIPAVSTPPVPREPFRPSRRSVLLGMTALSASTAIAGWPGLARATPPPSGRLLWSLTKEVFINLAAWYISAALPELAFTLRDKDIKESETSTPGGTSHHNECACLYQIRKQIKVVRTRYGFYLGLDQDGFLRAHTDENIPIVKDVNTIELLKMQHIHERNNNLLLFPCGPREVPTVNDKVRYSDFCDANGVDKKQWELSYCRDLNDTKQKHRGFGIKRKGIESDLDGATEFLVGNKH